MKIRWSILILSLAPAFAWAAGSHAGGHGGSAHATAGHDAAVATQAAAAVGQPGDPQQVSRTIEVVMDDTMRFTPAHIQVKEGETIRFQIHNRGAIAHEMVIGSMADMQAHAAEMQKMPGMQHAEPNMLTLEPGGSGVLIWQFGQAGQVDFACLIPGHLEAGMKGTVAVGETQPSSHASH